MNSRQYLIIRAACFVGLGLLGAIRLGTRTRLSQKPPERFIVARQDTQVSASGATAPSGAEAARPMPHARNMHHGPGVSIVNTDGTYNLANVEVAIPGPLGSVEFVKGTDPRAAEFLASEQERRAGIITDLGPPNVDPQTTPPMIAGHPYSGTRRMRAGDLP